MKAVGSSPFDTRKQKRNRRNSNASTHSSLSEQSFVMSVNSGYENIMSPESESILKENVDSNFDCGAVKPLNNPYENSDKYMEFDLGNLKSDEDISNNYEKDFNELFDMPAVKMLLNSKQEAGEVRKQHLLNTWRHIETHHICGDICTFIFDRVNECAVHLTEELLQHSFNEIALHRVH